MIYSISIIVALALAYKNDILYGTKNNRMYVCFMLWLILISSIQYMVGIDTYFYDKNYVAFNTNSFRIKNILDYQEDRLQPGYVLLIYVLRLLTDNFILCKTLIAIFINYSIFRFFRKVSSAPFLCVLGYCLIDYLVFNFNMLRESISVAIFLWIYDPILEKKHKKILAILVLAYLFHNSAIVTAIAIVVVYVVLWGNKSFQYILAGLSFVIIYIALFSDWGTWISMVISFDFLGSTDAQAASNYFTVDDHRLGYAGTQHYNIIGILYNLILRGYPLAVVIYYAKTKKIWL